MFGIDSIGSEWLIALGMISIATFILSLLIVPFIIVRIPQDYFSSTGKKSVRWSGVNPIIRPCLVVLKNLAGVILLIMGILMLVLPGQGLLTILFGIALLDFPGKHKLVRRIVSYPKLLNSINWVRKKANREPLLVD